MVYEYDLYYEEGTSPAHLLLVNKYNGEAIGDSIHVVVTSESIGGLLDDADIDIPFTVYRREKDGLDYRDKDLVGVLIYMAYGDAKEVMENPTAVSGEWGEYAKDTLVAEQVNELLTEIPVFAQLMPYNDDPNEGEDK